MSSLGRWRRPASSGCVEVSRGVVREGGVECEIVRQMGAALAYRTFVVKKELSRKAKLSIYWPVCTLTYGHEFCVATQSTRSQKWVSSTGWLGGGRSFRATWGEKLSHLGGARSRVAALLHQEESAEEARAPVPDATWTPPC